MSISLDVTIVVWLLEHRYNIILLPLMKETNHKDHLLRFKRAILHIIAVFTSIQLYSSICLVSNYDILMFYSDDTLQSSYV